MNSCMSSSEQIVPPYTDSLTLAEAQTRRAKDLGSGGAEVSGLFFVCRQTADPSFLPVTPSAIPPKGEGG